MHKQIWGIVAALFLVAGMAQAKSDWHKVADLTTGGDAKEVAVNREVSKVRIVSESGTVVINTVVVRVGAQKTPHTVGARLAEKEDREIELGSKQNITGLRISDSGKGTYSVYVK
ncbi:MAG: hypothetical protein K8T26_08795 [Lentisphaerae bacterium]|nr:hypothetical protein [Lentisphaerota bacterium]